MKTLIEFNRECERIEIMIEKEIEKKKDRYFIFYCPNCSETYRTKEKDLEFCSNCSEQIEIVFDSSEIISDCIRCFYSESCMIRKRYPFDITDCDMFKI